MKSTVETLEDNKVKLSVEVDETEFETDINAAFRKIAHEVRLPGFRPGKAPRKILEAKLGLAPAREQALRDGIPQYLARAVREHDVDIIATPEVQITGGEEDGPVSFDATIDVRPRVSVPGYGGLRVELLSPNITDEDVESPIQTELRRNGSLNDIERQAVRGDYVTIDLAADRDGEPVAGLNTEDWQYEIGKGWVADSFDTELIGTNVGDTKEFNAVPTGVEEAADFTITVKKVQEMVLPELTDEWVAENVGEFETVDAWRDSIRTRMTGVRMNQIRQTVAERTSQALADLVDIEVPETLIGAELNGRAQNFLQQLQGQGIQLEQYLAITGQDQETLVAGLREASVKAVKVDLALRSVADSEDLFISYADIEEEYERIARSIGQKPTQVQKAYERNDAVADLTADLRKRKAMEWLLDRVELVDPEGHVIERSLVFPEAAVESTPDLGEAVEESN
jgi:trigger factor